MAISVTTGGPIKSMIKPLKQGKLTYRDLINQISDELDDTNDTYLPQIQTAVQSAIRLCSREPFYFNQNHELLLSLIPGQARYDANAKNSLLKCGNVCAAYCENNGQIFEVKRQSAAQLLMLQNGLEKQRMPTYYSFVDDTLCLYPTPDKAYLLKLLLNPSVLPGIDNPNSSSAWFDGAFEFIKARTKYDIYKDILKDAGLAAAALNDFNEARTILQTETSRRAGVERICATQF